MRRRRGLFITIIILIILLIIAIVGIILWQFVLKKDNGTTANNIQEQSTNIPQEPITYPIQVGDYVDYTPDTAANYLLTEDATGSTDNSETGVKQEDLKWRILSINDDGTVDIISEEPISTEIYLGGAVGYNNAVYLMNNICEKQYSNEELGVIARSLNIKDIEDNMSETGIEEKNSYSSNEITYGDKRIYTADNSYVPAIYAELSLEVENESLPYYEKATAYTAVKAETVSLLQTFYKLENLTETYFEDENLYDLLFNTLNGSWIATRCIDCSSENTAMFGLFSIGNYTIGASAVYISNGQSSSAKNYIRPIVTLGEDIEISELEAGTVGSPRTLTKLDLSDDTEEEYDDFSDVQINADETAVRIFNANFTPYEGENQSASQIRSLISAVRSSNANSEHQIELQGTISELKANGKYTVELEYDADNWICTIIITEQEDSSNEFEDAQRNEELLDDQMEIQDGDETITGLDNIVDYYTSNQV